MTVGDVDVRLRLWYQHSGRTTQRKLQTAIPAVINRSKYGSVPSTSSQVGNIQADHARERQCYLELVQRHRLSNAP